MSLVNITNIVVLNSHSLFKEALRFQITFECMQEIKEEIEWNITYVGSAMDEQHDQVLDSFSMGPLSEGVMQFDLEVEAPDHTKIPSSDDLLGVTALIISVSYLKREFFRAGYYLCNQYEDQDIIDQISLLEESAQPVPIYIDQLYRNILADKPRITRFDIDWFNKHTNHNNITNTNHDQYQIMKSDINILNSQIQTNSKLFKDNFNKEKSNESNIEIQQDLANKENTILQ